MKYGMPINGSVVSFWALRLNPKPKRLDFNVYKNLKNSSSYESIFRAKVTIILYDMNESYVVGPFISGMLLDASIFTTTFHSVRFGGNHQHHHRRN